ncbi:MAG: hypothetical protein EB116_15635 [Betaproteobacteria bacterium]|nr:hypothetical protein [Betaproteobacteria bacterium]
MTSYVSVFTGDVIQPTDVSYQAFSISANLDLVWPQDGDAAGDYVARIMQISASTSGLFVDMPPANQTSVGTDSLIRNVGANSFTVRDYNGNTIVAVAAGDAKYVYVTSNATAAGTWGVIAFGAGSSSANASTLAGYGLKAISTTLNQSHPVATTSSTFTAGAADRAKNYVWTGGAGSVTLLDATTLGNDWFVMLRNGGTGTLTVTPSSGQLINGSASLVMQVSDSAFICCSGTAFYTVGLGRTTNFAFSVLAYPITSGGSPYTLTAAQAQNTIISLTGTLTTPVTINVPAVVQVYYVLNASTGSTVTFTTGIGGSSSSTLNPSTQAILICDATNVLNASTVITGGSAITLINGSAAAPSLNFSGDVTTGLYFAAGDLGFSINGTSEMTLGSGGLTVVSGISGGTFP